MDIKGQIGPKSIIILRNFDSALSFLSKSKICKDASGPNGITVQMDLADKGRIFHPGAIESKLSVSHVPVSKVCRTLATKQDLQNTKELE